MSKTAQNRPTSAPHQNSHGASRAISMTKLAELKDLVRKDQDTRLLLIIAMGSLTLRISDILNLTVQDLYGPDWIPLEVLKLREQKTGKRRLIPLQGIKSLLLEFADELKAHPLSDTSPLFVSEKRRTRLSRNSVNRMLGHYRALLRLPQLSPHSLRKGTCRHLVLEKGWSISIVQQLLAHSSERITSRYLDINAQDVEAAFADIPV